MEPEIFSALRAASYSEFFLRPDLDLHARGVNGQSLLHEAIAFGKTDIAKELIARKIDLDLQNRNGQTALHYAAVYGNVEIAQLMLQEGASVGIADQHGNEALWTAALAGKGNSRMIQLLVAHGADVNHKNNAGRTVRDFAKQSRDESLLRALIGSQDGAKTV